MSAMGELTFFLGLQVLQKKDGIFLSQDKYVGDILKKFGYSNVRSMIRSLMYLTASRPDIMFAVCACARHQVTPKECHLHAVKRIFRYLKGHPKLGLWYPKESPFDLVAYSDSDYGGATQDRKSTTGEYVAAASGYGQVLWIQNQMLDYGYNFMNTKIYIEHNIDFHKIVEFLEASHIRIETTNQETKILATVDGKSWTISESALRRNLKLSDEEGISSLPDWKFLIHTIMKCLSPKSTGFKEFSSNIATAVVYLATNRVYNFSKMIFDGMVRNINNELASLSRDDRQREAFPTVSSLDVGQDRENINKTSALPHESLPRVTSLDADEGSMQQRIHELMELCTSLQRQQSQMAAKIKDQDLEISGLKTRVKSLEDKEIRSAEPTQEDASITGGIIETGEELGTEKSIELGSNNTKEMVNVLNSMKATNILTSGVAAASVSPAADVPSVSGSFPTTSVKVVESEVPKKRKLQEQIDAQVAKEMEKEFARENQRVSEKLVRDSEIARLHAEEELKMMIEGLERSNEVITKHLQEYEQAAADLSSKPLSNKEQREFYMLVLRSHARWKTKHFRGMTLEQLKEKFIHVWKQFEYFVPMNAKEENERIKRQGLKIDQGSSKRMKTSKSVFEDVSEEELKGMMQLVPLEEVYVKALQVKHPIIDWEIYSEGKREYWKIIRLGGHTAVYQFFVDMLKQFNREDLHQL
nr:hypothetical protein [Tanacetum cinerariifolium]